MTVSQEPAHMASPAVTAAATGNAGTELPAGMVAVPLGRGCILVLTRDEYLRAIRRGKLFRRRAALTGRLATKGSDPILRHGPRPDR